MAYTKEQTALGRERLRALAYKLLSVPSEKFVMTVWTGERSAGWRWSGGFRNNYACNLNECGTVACAWGWATEIFPELQRNQYGIVLKHHGRGRPSKVAIGVDQHIRLAAKFFAIDIETAEFLFTPDDMHEVTREKESERLLEIANR